MKSLFPTAGFYWIWGIILLVMATFTNSTQLSVLGLAWVIMAASINIRMAILEKKE